MIRKLSLWFQHNSTKESYDTNRIVCIGLFTTYKTQALISPFFFILVLPQPVQSNVDDNAELGAGSVAKLAAEDGEDQAIEEDVEGADQDDDDRYMFDRGERLTDFLS